MKPGDQETVSLLMSYYTVITVFNLQPEIFSAVDQGLTQSNKTLLKSMATSPRETTLTWQYMLLKAAKKEKHLVPLCLFSLERRLSTCTREVVFPL